MKRARPLPGTLGREVSPLWLLPLSLVGLPFLLATLGRLCGALGATGAGETLVSWARAYGNWPLFALGFQSALLQDSILGFIVAGVVYSGVVFLVIAGFRLARGRAGEG